MLFPTRNSVPRLATLLLVTFLSAALAIAQGKFNQPGNILVTDQFNNRVIEIDPGGNIVWQYGHGPGDTAAGAIVWQYGENGVSGVGLNQLNSPNATELLANGNVLITDESNNRAVEVTHVYGSASTIVKTFTIGGSAGAMAFASRLPSGHTLLTDAGNNRIVEVDSSDSIVWEFDTSARPGSNTAPSPTRAVRLANGNTLISDQFNDQVIEVNSSKQIVAAYGTIALM